MYVEPAIFAVSTISSGRKLMAAVPPAASWAFATRLMVTKFVNDCASGVVERTSFTACAMRSRIGSVAEIAETAAVPSVYELSLIALLPTLVLTNRFKGSGVHAYLSLMDLAIKHPRMFTTVLNLSTSLDRRDFVGDFGLP